MTRLAQVEAAYLKAKERLGRRGRAALAALSLVYGVISGVTLTRDYAHSRLLVGSLAGFVMVSSAYAIWGVYAERARAQRPVLLDALASATTQACVQYIVMFCLPLLVFAEAWVTAGLALTIIAASFVDRLWVKVSRSLWYAALVRSFCAVLATSFGFAVFFPQQLRSFYPTLLGVAVAGALPWNRMLSWEARRVTDLLPALLILAVGVAQAGFGAWLRVPLLSVWLRQPAIGTGLADRTLGEAWRGPVPRRWVSEALARGERLCCLTPVVSPSGVNAAVTHEWRVDGKVIDRVALPPVIGQDDAAGNAFRTFSCKQNLPPVESIHTLTCRVLIDGEIYVGKAEIALE